MDVWFLRLDLASSLISLAWMLRWTPWMSSPLVTSLKVSSSLWPGVTERSWQKLVYIGQTLSSPWKLIWRGREQELGLRVRPWEARKTVFTSFSLHLWFTRGKPLLSHCSVNKTPNLWDVICGLIRANLRIFLCRFSFLLWSNGGWGHSPGEGQCSFWRQCVPSPLLDVAICSANV